MPSLAYSRKQIRQRPKSRINPCARPQRKQRLTARVLYLGVFFERAITDFLAIRVNVRRNITSSFLYRRQEAAPRRKRGISKELKYPTRRGLFGQEKQK